MKRTLNIKIKFIGLFFSAIIICFTKNGYSQPEFVENKGQFQENILFSLKHNAGHFYFENNITEANYSKKSFVNSFLNTLRQRIDDPRGIKRAVKNN